jgi:hypothetical protein
LGTLVFLGENDEYFGQKITMKASNTLRIGFQNIGGFTPKSKTLKDEIIRNGINTWEFDIIGLAETNVDWRLVGEEDKLIHRTKEWWESLHLSYSSNSTKPPIKPKQYGGVALFSINKAAHRVVSKGSDPSNLGRWTWTRYRGRNNHTLRIICAYRPNPPSGGPFTVYAQHKIYFNSIEDQRCPRAAFIQDLCEAINGFKSEGDHIILLLDGNSDMHKGPLAVSLSECNLREVLLDKYGLNAPSTYRRNQTPTPIDGIWASPNVNIEGGGYFLFDEVFQDMGHKCLWIDVTYINAFGHNMPPIVRPAIRRLHCKDPRIVNNFLRRYEKFVTQHQLIE